MRSKAGEAGICSCAVGLSACRRQCSSWIFATRIELQCSFRRFFLLRCRVPLFGGSHGWLCGDDTNFAGTRLVLSACRRHSFGPYCGNWGMHNLPMHLRCDSASPVEQLVQRPTRLMFEFPSFDLREDDVHQICGDELFTLVWILDVWVARSAGGEACMILHSFVSDGCSVTIYGFAEAYVSWWRPVWAAAGCDVDAVGHVWPPVISACRRHDAGSCWIIVRLCDAITVGVVHHLPHTKWRLCPTCHDALERSLERSPADVDIWACAGELASCLVGFALSGMAILGASLLKLLLAACGLRGGSYNVDPAIRGGRRIVAGAPTRFWMLYLVSIPIVAATGALEQRAVASTGAPSPVCHPGTSQATLRELSLQYRDLQLLISEAENHNLVESAEHLDPPFGTISPEADEPIEAIQMPVRVLQFQKNDVYTVVRTTPGMTGEELIANASSALLTHDSHFHMFDLFPQPQSEMIVLVTAPRWWRASSFVPVVVDAEEIRRPMPVRDGQVLRPTEGSLLRVFRANDVVDRVLETDIALQNLQWAWDVSTRGMPRSPTGDGRLMIIGPDYSFVLSSANTLTFQQVQESHADGAHWHCHLPASRAN